MALTPTERKLLREQITRAERLDEVHLTCRLLGHAWSPIEPDRIPEFGRLLVWECARCTSKRDDIFDSKWGTLLARTYRYVDGYLIKRTDEMRSGRTFSNDALRVVIDRRIHG